MASEESTLNVCYKCNRVADFICPECGSKICKYHMEFRYTGTDRGLRSRFMCPVCWLVKRVIPDERMIRPDKPGCPESSPPSQWDKAYRPKITKRKKK